MSSPDNHHLVWKHDPTSLPRCNCIDRTHTLYKIEIYRNQSKCYYHCKCPAKMPFTVTRRMKNNDEIIEKIMNENTNVPVIYMM